jgi:hypothetical protein
LKLNLEHPKISGDTTVQNAITEVAAMMGENVRLRRGFVMSAPSPGVLSTYLHTSPQPGTVFWKCLPFFSNKILFLHAHTAHTPLAHTHRMLNRTCHDF